MMSFVSQVLTKTKNFPLNQNFTCAKYGIYVMAFVICHQSVDQIVNNFSTRWASRKGTWNKPDNRDDSKQMVSSQLYTVFCGTISKPPIYEAYTVTFVEHSPVLTLWIAMKRNGFKLIAQINIQSMILPCGKQFLYLFALFIDFSHSVLPNCLTFFTTQ